jgi:hypothetical protein
VKCHQCDRPALYWTGDEKHRIPLCLDCNLKVQQIAAMQQEVLEREINFLTQEMNYIGGLSSSPPRYPERRPPVHVQGNTFNNFKVEGSSIGLLNTGSIGVVDSAITVIANAGDQRAAGAIQKLTQAIISSSDLPPDKKNELIEMMNLVAAEAALPADKRRKRAIKPVLASIADGLKVSKGLVEIWDQASQLILWGGDHFETPAHPGSHPVRRPKL